MVFHFGARQLGWRTTMLPARFNFQLSAQLAAKHPLIVYACEYVSVAVFAIGHVCALALFVCLPFLHVTFHFIHNRKVAQCARASHSRMSFRELHDE